MAKKSIRHLDFSTLVMINREVVSLTGENHEYTGEDERRLKSLVEEVQTVSNNEEFGEAILQKTALLVYRIARGQHFHEGNKRTALVAASAFLQMNGYSLGIKNMELVSMVDKAGIATATLNDIQQIIRKVVGNEPDRT